MRILIAEDEVELAKGLKFLLGKNKFSVDIVHDGADAIDCFVFVCFPHSAVYEVTFFHLPPLIPSASALLGLMV